MIPRLQFIVGPTASGKTGLAIREAKARGAVILSCDSLCVYRGMDIGTAKPTADEQAEVPHFGIDLVDPCAPYSVARYIAYRDEVLERARSNGRTVVVAGGSGFYLKSFFFPVVDEVDIPAEVEARVSALSAERGRAGMGELLKEINRPEERFEGLDQMNARRVEKALLRCLATGRSYSSLLESFADLPAPLSDWDKEVWLIERSAEELRERNRRRVESMLAGGLIEEVSALREKGFENNPSACGAIGYREGLGYLDGEVSRGDLAGVIYTHTNQLMRKQRTWFRSQVPVNRVVSGE